MERIIKSVKLAILQGDITKQSKIEAIVNSANAELMPGEGVSGAIHKAAGQDLYKEAKHFAPIKTGQAIITKAYKLPSMYIIHTLGPVYGTDNPPEVLLADCYRNSLLLADGYNLKSIAFPAISSGIFGYPAADAAKVAITEIIKTIPSLKYLKDIYVVLYDNVFYDIYSKILSETK